MLIVRRRQTVFLVILPALLEVLLCLVVTGRAGGLVGSSMLLATGMPEALQLTSKNS